MSMKKPVNKIEKLIDELCADGVEFKELGEIAIIKNGKDWKILGNGDIPVYGTGGIMGYVDKYAYNKPTVLIPRKGSIENIFYLEVPFWNIDTIYYTEIDTDVIIPKFLYYFIKIIDLKRLDTGSGRPSLTQAILKKIKIPIPPLAIQKEIVKILDNFTELEAELEARKKQYEHYRGSLFEFRNEELQWKTLGDIYDFQYGKGNTIPTIGGDYPVYGSNGVVGRHNEYNSQDAPVIGHIGAYAGIVNWGHGKHFVTYNGVICRIKEGVNPKYGYYYLLLQDFRSKARSGSQPFVSYDILKRVEIPIPPLSEQKRIVSILDKFYALVSDISIGLPA